MTTPLLLLHGAIGSKSQYDKLAAALSDNFEVHAIDFEGHGAQPDAGRPFRMSHFAENVITYMDQHNIAQANLFGHSMGGYVALLLAAHAPKRVGKVFTLGLMFNWNPDVAQQLLRNFNVAKIKEKVPHFAQALAERHTGIGWEENMAKSADMTLDLGHSHTLTHDLLATIEHPVIVSLGDQDNATTLEESAAAARTLPNGALQVFPHTKHPLERINVPMVTHAVERFLLN